MSFDADDPNFPAKRLKLSNKDDISQENARENPDPFATPTKSSFDLTRNEPSTELPLISATLPPSALLEANGNRNAPSFTLCATLMGHSKGLSTVKISPDAKYVVTAGGDGQLLLYTLDTYAFVRAFEGHTGGINDIAWSPDGQYIASASDDKSVRVWYAKDASLYRFFQGHTSYVFCLAYNLEGTVLVSGGFDETLAIWDIKKGRNMKTIGGAHDDPISCVAFSHDSATIASCSYDKLIRLWDSASYQCLKTILHTSPFSYLTFTPNNKFLLTCALDSTLCLIGCESGKVVKTYTGHSNARLSITPTLLFNSLHTLKQNTNEEDSRDYIISGSEDGKIWIWDIQSREMVASWQAHVDSVICVDYKKGFLASASLEKDQTARVWKMA